MKTNRYLGAPEVHFKLSQDNQNEKKQNEKKSTSLSSTNRSTQYLLQTLR